jgi:hypothetical protein
MENIVFENIETNHTEYKFGHGIYGHSDDSSSLKLIIITGNTGDNAKYNGYVNGPKLVSQALTKGGNPKKFEDWIRTNDAKNKIEYIISITGIPVIEIKTGGNANDNLVAGTYIHPDLVLAVATWASNDFYFQASKIVREYSIQHRIRKKQKEFDIVIAKKDILIGEKNNIIEKTSDENKSLKQLMAEMESRLISNSEDTRISLEDKIMDVQDDLTEQIERVQTKFDTSVIHRVPPCTDESRNEYFMLIVLDEGEYKAVRGQKAQIKKMKLKHRNKRYIEFQENPNPQNLLNRLRERKDTSQFKIRNTKITLQNDFSELQLIDLINEVNKEKKDVDVIQLEKEIMYTQEGLTALKMAELRTICRDKQIKKYSQYRKSELVNYILSNL